MKTRKWSSHYPPRTKHLGGKLAALLATMLLLLTPASAMAGNGYIVKLSADGTTLTFTANDGTTVDNKNCWTLDEWDASKLSNTEQVTTVKFDNTFSAATPTKTHHWFHCMSKLEKIEGLGNLNTSEVTNMESMFGSCSSLTELDLSNFNTEKVTNMKDMFYFCNSLTELDLSKFNTTEVTNMNNMFSNCQALKSLNLSSFNTAKVTNMMDMFSHCEKLTTLTFGKYFNTINVESTNMENMFKSCKSLTKLDLSSFNTSNITSTENMFNDCPNLQTIIFGENFNTKKVTNMNNMFTSCIALTTLDLSNFNTEKVTSTENMFLACTNLKNLILGNNYFKNAPTTSNAFQQVSGCQLTVGTGFDVSVLGTADASGKYTWLNGTFSLLLTLDEEKENNFAATPDGTMYSKAVLKRTFNDNAWNTLVVPFDITADEAKKVFGENAQIAKYTGATTNENTDVNGFEYILNFETSTDGIKANEPVFIYGVKNTSDNCYTFTGKTVTKATPTKTDDNMNFVGTYATGYVPQGNYFIDSHNKIYRAANENTNAIKATRATFAPVSANNEAKIASFVIGDGTTGINLPTTVNRVADGAAYNLQGQRVGPNYKGMVIQQGKKYLRK